MKNWHWLDKGFSYQRICRVRNIELELGGSVLFPFTILLPCVLEIIVQYVSVSLSPAPHYAVGDIHDSSLNI